MPNLDKSCNLKYAKYNKNNGLDLFSFNDAPLLKKNDSQSISNILLLEFLSSVSIVLIGLNLSIIVLNSE